MVTLPKPSQTSQESPSSFSPYPLHSEHILHCAFAGAAFAGAGGPIRDPTRSANRWGSIVTYSSNGVSGSIQRSSPLWPTMRHFWSGVLLGRLNLPPAVTKESSLFTLSIHL